MKRYLVKLTYTATESNQNFAGEVLNYYYGRNHFSTENPIHVNSMARHWGYTTKAAAIQGLKSHKSMAEAEAARGAWNCSCELLEIELAE